VTPFSLNDAQGVVVCVSQWQLHYGCVEKSNCTPEFSHSLGREKTLAQDFWVPI